MPDDDEEKNDDDDDDDGDEPKIVPIIPEIPFTYAYLSATEVCVPMNTKYPPNRPNYILTQYLESC